MGIYIHSEDIQIKDVPIVTQSSHSSNERNVSGAMFLYLCDTSQHVLIGLE